MQNHHVGRRLGALVLAAALTLVAGCGGSDDERARDAGTQAAPSTSTAEPAPTDAAAPADTAKDPAAAETPDPATEPSEQVPAGNPNQSFSGTSLEETVTFEDLGPDLVVATITHDGGSNFSVNSLNEHGDHMELLVNTVGPYEGTVPLNLTGNPASLEIMTSGNWTVTTAPLSTVPVWDGEAPLEGEGSQTIVVDGVGDDSTQFTFTYVASQSSNFIVRAMDQEQQRGLVNELGEVTTTSPIPAWALVLVITSEGTWTISK